MDSAVQKLVSTFSSFFKREDASFTVDATLDRATVAYPVGTTEPDATAADAIDARVLDGRPLRGDCPVCGQSAQFTGFTENLRESGLCSRCGSSNRNRQMGSLLRRQFGLARSGPLALPVGAILNAESSGPLHERLKSSPGYVFSEYWGPQYRPGEIVHGIRHEDLQNLSFGDGTFDLVLSSDVLEHMPDPYRAHAEILRVLRPGGRHLFTVPFVRGWSHDEVRAELVEGEIVYLKEKIYHGDPIRPEEGVLVWRIFGMEMLSELSRMGYRVTMWILHEPSRGILGRENTIFEAFKA